MNNVKYPTHEQIINMLKNYIDNSVYKYAVLIDGDWGSGKTYFAKNILKKRLKEHIKPSNKYKDIVYTSFYGVNSIQDASSKLYLSLVGANKNIAKRVTPLLSSLLKGANININISDVGSSLSTFVDISRYVIIIDDLERCNCDISEIMGLLNNFVEHSETKLILIANEKEIQNNPESLDALQCIAAVNGKINPLNKEKNQEKFTREDLLKITKELFDRKSNYEKIKEKLIGQTIIYKPNLVDVIKIIIKSQTQNDELLQKLLLDTRNYFMEEMEKNANYNLRTFQFFLDKIITISNIINQSKYDKYNNVMPILVKYTFFASLRYKQGKGVQKWNENVLYAAVNTTDDPYLSSHITGFAFIDYAIEHNIFDENFIKESIDSYFQNTENNKNNSAYQQDGSVQILSVWWEYSEEEVRNAIEDICNKTKNKVYGAQYYITIIKLLIYPIADIDLDGTSFESTFDFMLQEIKNNKVNYSWHDYYCMSEVPAVVQKHKELIAIIQQTVKEKEDDDLNKKLDEIFSSQTWGETLYENYRESNNMPVEKQSIISKLNIDKIIELIKTSSNKQINMFRLYITELYGFANIHEFYKGDIPNIEKLIYALESLSTSAMDKIKKKQINSLLRLLKDKLSELKQ